MGASGLGQVLAFLQNILLVPFFIAAWGVGGYGQWVILTSFVSYLGLIEFGGQPYIANLMAEAHAKGDEKNTSRILSEATSFFLLLGIAILVLLAPGLVVSQAVVMPGLGRPLTAVDAWVLGCMAAVLLVFGIPVGVYLTVYRATGLFARGMMMGNALKVFGLAVSVSALITGASLKIYAICMLGVAALQTMAIVWDSRRIIPACRDVRIGAQAAVKGKAYLSGSVYCWLIAVAQALMQQGLIFILSVYAAPEHVALYATHRALASISGYAGLLLLGPMLPEISFHWASGRHSEVKNVTIFSIKSVIIATGVLAAGLWLAAPEIYPLWTGRRLNIDSMLLLVMLVQGTLAAGWATSTWGLLATNQFRPMAGWYLANAAVTMGLAVWWVKPYGLVGIACASLVGDVACGLLAFPVLASVFLDMRRSEIYGAMLRAAGALMPLLIGAWLLSHAAPGWPSIALLVLAAPLWGYLALRMAFGKEETWGVLKKCQEGFAARLGRGT